MTKLTTEEWRELQKQIEELNENTTDEVLYKYLLKITTHKEMKEISGIFENEFILGAIAYFGRKKGFTPKYRNGILKTLRVYRNNIGKQKNL